MNEHVKGAEGEVFPDPASNRVVARFKNPATGEYDVELYLSRDVALDFAFNLTASAYALTEE